MAVILTAGISWAEDLNNNSRIQNLELDLLARLPTSGYVSVPLMPVWEKINRAKKETSYDSEEGIAHNMNDAYASTSVLWYGWMSAETDPNAYSKYLLPIQLPDGVTITSFHFWAYDNDPISDGRVILRMSGPTIGGAGYHMTSPPSLYTSGIGDVPRKFTAGAIKPSLAIVDNSKYSYSLEAKLSGGSDVVLMSAVVGYRYGVDPPGGGDVDYSGTWEVVENVFQAQCWETGESLITLNISHAGNEITFYPEEGDPLTAELIGNTVTVDTVDPGTGADSFRFGLTFTSANTFEGQFVERWSDGECFQRTTITGSRQ
jgi:hypothetical protein